MKLLRTTAFTMIEIVVTIVILGILGAVAIPVVQSSLEAPKQSEAMLALAEIRQAEIRYKDLNGAFTASIGDLDCNVATPGNSATCPSATADYTYSIISADINDFNARATRQLSSNTKPYIQMTSLGSTAFGTIRSISQASYPAAKTLTITKSNNQTT